MRKLLLKSFCLLVALALFHGFAHAENAMLLFPNSDFEQGTLENWRLEGDGFEGQPTKGDNVRARAKDRRVLPQGQFWASSYENYNGAQGQKPGKAKSDKAMGAMISNPFDISKPFISFLMLGGRSEKIQVQLIVQSSVVYSVTGAESSFMRQVVWDVGKYQGQKAQVYVIDRSEELWGQIGVDDFRYLDAAPNLELFPNSDFELGELGNWSADGEAFKVQPTKGDNVEARTQGSTKAGLDGNFWIATFEKYSGAEGQKPGDIQDNAPKGTLTSIPFEIKGEAIVFNIAGGKKDNTRVELLVDGKAVKRALGDNSATLKPVVWDLEKLKGKTAEIKITDDSAEEWGFISCDSFRWAREPGVGNAAAMPINGAPMKIEIPERGAVK